MKTNFSRKLLRFYFWFLLIVTSATYVQLTMSSFFMGYIPDVILSYISFIAFFGYAYDKRILTKAFWNPFLIGYLVWEAWCYFFRNDSSLNSVLVFLFLCPKYWSLIHYVFVTLEKDESKKEDFLQKFYHPFDRIKSISWSNILPSLFPTKRILVIRIIAFVTILTTCYSLFPTHWGYWLESLYFRRDIYELFEGASLGMVLFGIGLYILPIGKLVVGSGLFKLKLWGKKAGVCILGADFLARLVSAVNLWTYYDRHPEKLKVLQSLKASGDFIEIETISMWPSYIIAILSLLSLIILLTIDFEDIG